MVYFQKWFQILCKYNGFLFVQNFKIVCGSECTEYQNIHFHKNETQRWGRQQISVYPMDGKSGRNKR